jgi:hypothetical protein
VAPFFGGITATAAIARAAQGHNGAVGIQQMARAGIQLPLAKGDDLPSPARYQEQQLRDVEQSEYRLIGQHSRYRR